MHANWVIDKLSRYNQRYPEEAAQTERFMEFVRRNENCFQRSLQQGHVTGSALLLHPNQDAVLLTHHKKLDLWIQLGGHSDGNPHSLEVALREAREESGITEIFPLREEIFSVDIHAIPAIGKEPEHWHYDLSFLLQAKTSQFTVSNESHQLQWFPLSQLYKQKLESSVERMLSRLLKESDYWLPKHC